MIASEFIKGTRDSIRAVRSIIIVVETSARAEPSLGGGLVLYAELITAAGKNSKIKCVWITLGEVFLGLMSVREGLRPAVELLLESGSPVSILQDSPVNRAGAERCRFLPQRGRGFLASEIPKHISGIMLLVFHTSSSSVVVCICSGKGVEKGE